jgi:hypothetical protein
MDDSGLSHRWTLRRADMRLIARYILAASLLIAWGVPGNSSARAAETMTPLLLAVHDAPVPFTGSDGRVHLVYELWMTNFSSGNLAIQKAAVYGDGRLLEKLDSAAVAGRLQPAGERKSGATLGPGQQALLFLHITLAGGAAVPHTLSHTILLKASAAPPGQQERSESGGATTVDRQEVVVVGPPLRGKRYISADSCCDSSRHTRAAMPINARVWVAQRYAVDWEELDAHGRIYSGPREKLASYTIFGKPVLAVADGTVVAMTDGLPEQTPGKFPTNISLDEADGNSVILDLGGNRYAMYAHMQPGSIRVRKGQRIKLGQVIGLVGDSGNSVAPHLHFQVMSKPSSLASNGLPYAIDSFEVTGKTHGTPAFDAAEADGTPLAITPVSAARPVRNALPLDQLEITFVQR